MPFKTVYHKAGDGKVVEYLIDDIDAHEAVRKFPKEYSFEAPPKGKGKGDVEVEIDVAMTPQLASANGMREPPPPQSGETGPPILPRTPMFDR